MTLTQCKNKFCELASNLMDFLKLSPGNFEEEDNEKIYGFQDIILTQLNSAGAGWDAKKMYEKGDIVVRNRELYISKRDFNVNNDPSAEPFYWLKKGPVNFNDKGTVRAWARVENGNIVAGKNIDHVAVNSGYLDIYFSKNLDNYDYVQILNINKKEGASDFYRTVCKYVYTNKTRNKVYSKCNGASDLDNLSFSVYFLSNQSFD